VFYREFAMPRSAMKREELAGALAREHRLTRAAARDQVDELVHKILKSLRKGEPVVLPGVGRLVAKPRSRK
jgi:nucleoid DNA-binding protein